MIEGDEQDDFFKVGIDANGRPYLYSIIRWPKPLKKTRPRALKLREQGYSHTEISKKLGVSKSTVVAVCKESASGVKNTSTKKETRPSDISTSRESS